MYIKQFIMANDHYKKFITGSISGLIEVTGTHWLDTIKTVKQQQWIAGNKVGLVGTAKYIYNKGGIFNFYSGYGPRMIGIAPMRLFYWGVMMTMLDKTTDMKPFERAITVGTTTGFFQTVIDNPIEVMKTKFMSGQKFNIRYVMRGIVPCAIRNMMFAVPVVYGASNYSETPFLAGAVGGAIGGFISQPFDTVKTELQTQSRSSMLKIFTRYRTNITGLWTGVVPRMSLSFATMGIGLMAYDSISAFIEKVSCYE